MNRGFESRYDFAGGLLLWRERLMTGKGLLLLVVGACLLQPVRSFSQGLIRYEAEDLGDVVVGEDLWAYRFFVSGFTFGVDEGLSLFFDYQDYTKLAEASVGLDPKWDVLVIQPDVLLTADGFFDALATAANPATVAPFVVEFVWLGGVGNEPGDVPFYTYDANFAVMSSGVTSQVPEPQVWALAVLGGGLWWGWRRRQTSALRLERAALNEGRERA